MQCLCWCAFCAVAAGSPAGWLPTDNIARIDQTYTAGTCVLLLLLLCGCYMSICRTHTAAASPPRAITASTSQALIMLATCKVKRNTAAVNLHQLNPLPDWKLQLRSVTEQARTLCSVCLVQGTTAYCTCRTSGKILCI